MDQQYKGVIGALLFIIIGIGLLMYAAYAHNQDNKSAQVQIEQYREQMLNDKLATLNDNLVKVQSSIPPAINTKDIENNIMQQVAQYAPIADCIVVDNAVEKRLYCIKK